MAIESIRWMLSCSNAATFVLRVEAVWLGAPPGVELTFTWPPGNTGCCWHRTFFGSAYRLRFSRVTTGGAAIYCNSFPQWNAPELSIFAAFGNFCRWKVTVVSSVWPSFTRLCANMQTRPTIAHGNSRALAQRGFGATFPDTLIKHTYLDEGPTVIT